MPSRPTTFVCAFVLALPALSQPQAVIRVPQDAPTIADAIADASGDTRVELAPGLYRELITVEGFSLALAPQPGAEGQVSWSADLDDDGIADGPAITVTGGPGIRPWLSVQGIDFLAAGIDASYALVEVEGCSFTGGEEDVSRPLALYRVEAYIQDSSFVDNATNESGGAIMCDGGELIVRDSVFERCRSGQNGGAIVAASMVRLSLIGSLFTMNEAESDGGAILSVAELSIASIDGCTFSRNTAGHFTGAVSIWAHIRDSTFIQNTAVYIAGAVSLNGGRTPENGTIERCVFLDNHATTEQGVSAGGSICLEPGDVHDSLFVGNTAVEGGAIFAPRPHGYNSAIYRSRFVGNQAIEGGAVHGIRTTTGCSFISNSALKGSSIFLQAPFLTVMSSAFLDNAAPVVSWDFGDTDVPHEEIDLPTACVFGPNQLVTINGFPPTVHPSACVGDPALIGPGAIHLDPMFTRLPDDGGDGWGDDPSTPTIDEGANDDFGDLTPLPGSPLIDAAPMLDDLPALDLAGNPRVHDDPGIPTARPDIGPIEFQGTSCLADINHDALATPADLAAWIDAFNAGASLADQNRDGRINPADFNAWILNYNTGC